MESRCPVCNSQRIVDGRIGWGGDPLVFQLPSIPSEWQFLIDVIPAQLVADRLAALSGVDCDTFRLCSFVVEDDAGLLPASAERESS